MKKQIATLLALSTAAACILTYQPTAVGAEEYSVLDYNGQAGTGGTGRQHG